MDFATSNLSRWDPTKHEMANAHSSNEPIGFKVTKIICYLLIFTVSTFGNCAVIAVVCRSKIMRSVAGNLLILNLASCDFLTPFFSIPFDLAVEEEGQWLYGEAICRILWPLVTLTTTSSSLTLGAIAFERYRSLMHPFKSRLTITQVKSAIVGMHAFSLFLIIPYVLVLDLTEDEQCDEMHWPKSISTELRRSYTTALFIAQYIGPLFFMAFMYSQTSKSLVQSTERVRTSSTSSVESADSQTSRPRGGSFGNVLSNSPLSRSIFKNIQQEQNIKITKMFIGIVVIFAVCMLPNQVVWLWTDFGEGLENENIRVISIVCRFFAYTNSCLNPFIFFKFSREFRRRLRRAYTQARCCVEERRTFVLAYHRWRASHTRTMSTATQSTTTGTSKPGQAFRASPSDESVISNGPVSELEQSKIPKAAGRTRRTLILPLGGFWKANIGAVKVAGLCTLPSKNRTKRAFIPKEALPTRGDCENLSKLTKVPVKSPLTEASLGDIRIDVKDLATLPYLVETCC